MNTYIAGIPCVVEATHCVVQEPMGPRCDSDMDAYGYTEIEFRVLDRTGRPAPWLAKKMPADDESRIESELLAEYTQ